MQCSDQQHPKHTLEGRPHDVEKDPSVLLQQTHGRPYLGQNRRPAATPTAAYKKFQVEEIMATAPRQNSLIVASFISTSSDCYLECLELRPQLSCPRRYCSRLLLRP